jgi:hypothetical protein
MLYCITLGKEVVVLPTCAINDTTGSIDEDAKAYPPVIDTTEYSSTSISNGILICFVSVFVK